MFVNWHLPYFHSRCQRVSALRGFILSVKWVPLGHVKVRSLSVACRTHSGRVQRGRDTESDAVIRLKKYTHFSPTNASWAVPPEICIMRFPVILLITPKRTLLLRQFLYIRNLRFILHRHGQPNLRVEHYPQAFRDSSADRRNQFLIAHLELERHQHIEDQVGMGHR